MNYQEIINEIYRSVTTLPNPGEVANYISALAKVNPDKFGIHLCTISKRKYGAGDFQEKFSIQSIAKVFLLSMAYKLQGPELWKRLGVEPSGTAFNSLIQLETDEGIPRNPFMNAGAIVLCDVLISHFEKPKEAFLDFVRMVSENDSITYSPLIAASEKSSGYRNIALCHFIKSFGNIHNDPEEVLDFYFNLCSIEMSCAELSESFLYLANHGVRISDESQILSLSQEKRIMAIMQTCGFYDESGEFSFKVGLPGKSGVGGGIIAIHPDKYSIAVWSPRLNEKGNSFRGMKFLEEFTSKTQLSIF